MKYILLIRHAKTEQGNFNKDFERELTDRGISDCKIMAERLIKIKFEPELVLISPSRRTKQTAKYLSKYLDWEKSKIRESEKLYLAPENTILNEIIRTENSVNSLAIICHNPGITDFFNFIGNASTDNLPTCGMGIFKLDIDDWENTEAHLGKLEWYSWPKKID